MAFLKEEILKLKKMVYTNFTINLEMTNNDVHNASVYIPGGYICKSIFNNNDETPENIITMADSVDKTLCSMNLNIHTIDDFNKNKGLLKIDHKTDGDCISLLIGDTNKVFLKLYLTDALLLYKALKTDEYRIDSIEVDEGNLYNIFVAKKYILINNIVVKKEHLSEILKKFISSILD